ncbi:MAG TPA: tetratricopeptide repeat protein [Verrucomicrobiae bacterium]|jgi:tetratricopeptide (TPR) repeat protein|nr:tetratricopeptide repeat protein [Verrucomicrobiae bacterium]
MIFSVSDRRHMEAAEGWLGLGCPADAGAELDKVTPEWRGHPAVLTLRWQVDAAAGQWEAALQTAKAALAVAPRDPESWIHVSYALHELKRTTEARDHLRGAVELFPAISTIPYNLACYECQLGQMSAAIAWLEKAFSLTEDREPMKQAALQDPDLQPLWAQIKGR